MALAHGMQSPCGELGGLRRGKLGGQDRVQAGLRTPCRGVQTEAHGKAT